MAGISFSDMDGERRYALESGDYVGYASKCLELGITPEDHMAFEQGQLEIRLEGGSSVRGKTSREKNYEEFIQRSNGYKLNPDDIFSDANEKREIIRETMHYSSLRSSGGNMSIEECSDSKIGQTFRSIYKTAQKSLRI